MRSFDEDMVMPTEHANVSFLGTPQRAVTASVHDVLKRAIFGARLSLLSGPAEMVSLTQEATDISTPSPSSVLE